MTNTLLSFCKFNATDAARSMANNSSAILRKTALIVGLVMGGLLFPVHMFGIFGFGDMVWDPTNYAALGKIWAEDISMGAKMVQEFNQLVKIYQTDMAVYQLGTQMAQMMKHPQRLALTAVGPTFFGDFTKNKYGETVNWPSVMNGQVSFAQNAWSGSTLPLGPNPYLALEKVGSSYLLAKLATAEEIDGSSVRCTQILADYNKRQQNNKTAVDLLKAAGLDISGPVNSVVAQLNLQNAGSQQARAEQQSQGNIQACLAEQQMLANKRQRDQEVEDLNFTGQVLNYNKTENDTWTDGATALQGFKLP